MAVAAEAHGQAGHREPYLATGMMGMFIFLASEVMFFGSLFAAYFYLHGSNAVWPPTGTFPVEPVPIPAVNTVVLFSSGATCHVAHIMIQQGRRRAFVYWMIVTIVLGFLFEAGQAIEFARAYGASIPILGAGQPLHFNTNVFASAFFTMTGFHGAHVMGGLLFLLLILWRTAKGHFDAQHHVGVYAGVIYWHFVDLVWAFLFLVLYVGVFFHW